MSPDAEARWAKTGKDIYMKRFGEVKTTAALMAAAVMTISPIFMASPVFAASADTVTGVSGEQTDAAAAQTVTVNGLKAGSTVKLYQIVDGYYNSDKKLVKYVLMDPTNGKIAAIGDSTKGQTSGSNDIITESEITMIANNIQNGLFTTDAGLDMTIDATDKTKATASVEPGMYLVLANDPSGKTVYNPAVIAVNITDANDGTEQAGSVDMTSYFQFKENGNADVKDVYLKSSSSGSDKKIMGSDKAKVQAEGEKTGSNAVKQDNNASLSPDKSSAKGDVLAKGDTVHFQIDSMTIPSFSTDYTKPQYVITDTPDASFAKYSNLKVTVGGSEVSAADNTFTVSDNGVNGFKIAFAESYLEGLRNATAENRAVVVTYDAVLENPTYNYAENHNRVTVQYSNNPNDETSYNTENHDTYHYTFAIDSNIDSEDENAKTTYEFNKVNEKFNATTEKWTDQKSAAPLAGAVFTLYSDEECKNAVTTATSDADGHITIEGLDEGTYYLKETTAPSGYTLADQTYRFVIAATLDDTGALTEYSVTSSYKDATHSAWTESATARYTSVKKFNDDGSVTNTITRNDAPTAIIDTKLQALPSTSGSGTVVITVIAAAGMAICLAIYVANRKQKEEK